MVNRKNLYLLLIIISIIGVGYGTIYFAFYHPDNEFYSNINLARNHTLRDLNDSTATIEKIEIIEANCRAYSLDYREECERTLIKEIFQNKTKT